MSRDALFLVGGRLFQALLTVAALRLLTTLLSPVQVGSVYLMLSFAAWFGLFLVSPLGNYINRKLYGWHQGSLIPARFRLFNLYVLAVAALAFPLVFAAKQFFGLGSGLPLGHFMAAVALYVYALTWNQTVIPALNLLNKREAFVGFSVLSTGLGLALSCAFALYLGPTAYAWLYGQGLAFLAVYWLARVKLGSSTGSVPGGQGGFAVLTRDNLRGVWLFAGPLSVSALFMWFQTQSYRLIVERFAGPEFLGYLVIGLGIASNLGGVTESLVQQLYFPEFYRRLHGSSEEDRRQALAQLAGRALPVYLVLTAFTCALAPHLTRVLAAPQFHSAWKFLAVGAFIELFRMTTNIFSVTAHAEMKTVSLIKPFAVGGGATALAVLAVCLAGKQGLLVPAGMAAGGLVTLLLMRAAMGKLSRFPLDRGALLKSLALALGFLPAFFWLRVESLAGSAAVLSVFSLYFVFAQWRLMAGLKGDSCTAADAQADAEIKSFGAEA
ncbi:MAG: hypothetical protein A2049_04895 [Elusimicrobia bacterium GWA2_62_23]|nr:MAG: hypothetical protein A2049_04895 [Elusimicrobia bacterium GWA2_62_23]OGR68746.1 MAG: hypothetical protein A2179_07205 [Elusimicrobia bacterium GWC2_63_65]